MGFKISGDGIEFIEIDHARHLVERHESGWSRIDLVATIDEQVMANFFRFSIHDTKGPYHDVQIGHVQMNGFK